MSKEQERQMIVMSGYFVVNGVPLDEKIQVLIPNVHYDEKTDTVEYVSTCEVVTP
jgi:hypothetical protein